MQDHFTYTTACLIKPYLSWAIILHNCWRKKNAGSMQAQVSVLASECACIWFSTWSGPILSLRASCLSILSLRHCTTLLFCSDEKASRLNRHSVLYRHTHTKTECIAHLREWSWEEGHNYSSQPHSFQGEKKKRRGINRFFFFLKQVPPMKERLFRETSVSCAVMLEEGRDVIMVTCIQFK